MGLLQVTGLVLGIVGVIWALWRVLRRQPLSTQDRFMLPAVLLMSLNLIIPRAFPSIPSGLAETINLVGTFGSLVLILLAVRAKGA